MVVVVVAVVVTVAKVSAIVPKVLVYSVRVVLCPIWASR